MGTVRAEQAAKNLVELFKSLENGVSLLIFVTKDVRITKTFQDNYKTFVRYICHNEVPVVLVKTHCEQETNPDNWWRENSSAFAKYG